MSEKSKLEIYREEQTKDIKDCMNEMACQPILFVGSGLSKRYFGSPNWNELLEHLAKECPLIEKDYAYYKQTIGSLPEIGTLFAKSYLDWAWGSGKPNFPDELFTSLTAKDLYLKHKIAEHFAAITPKSLDQVKDAGHRSELESLAKIRPHAIITTNYDPFLEIVFPDYTRVIGQQIIRNTLISFGEIFKIHGCITEPSSLVVTKEDYEYFLRKKKYLSAKLLTFFSEHPLIFIGYSAGDDNIKAILSDIDEALPQAGSLVKNVYVLEWKPSLPQDYDAPKEKLIGVEEARSVRLKSIETDKFDWVFDAPASPNSLNPVSPKVLRTILARSFDLVRRDIPRNKVEVDFKMLESAVENSSTFAALFGITNIDDPNALAAKYPHTITALSKLLKVKGWNNVHKIMQQIHKTDGINLHESNNRYHIATKHGKSVLHKYSDDAYNLFKKVIEGKDYKI